MDTRSSDSGLYSPGARVLQDRHDTRRLADRLADVKVHDRFTADDRAFIEAVLSSVTVAFAAMLSCLSFSVSWTLSTRLGSDPAGIFCASLVVSVFLENRSRRRVTKGDVALPELFMCCLPSAMGYRNRRGAGCEKVGIVIR